MKFEEINKGYNSVFKPHKLSLGLVIPIENYAHGATPTMQQHLERVKLAEAVGFKAAWVRDVPFNVPSFGDVGQMYDPFVYLGYLAAQTTNIALGTASIALPLHHPVHVAKSAATIDQLSNGRLILGVASGDRMEEYPAMNIKYEERGERFREAFNLIRNAQKDFPKLETRHYGNLNASLDILPKPLGKKIPLLVTGHSQQSLEWNAENSDGWMSYPKDAYSQRQTIKDWRDLISGGSKASKPFMQPLYVDLQSDSGFKPEPIHLGFKIGSKYLVDYLFQLQEIGVNHLAFNLRFNKTDISHTLDKLGDEVLSKFH
ncbi:LLM class oxidoreductase [Labilibacter marinus]|uniref:LLM class oxidoreductase n=1 Tax=Labilibacter marinus TaxID=1477105 RepID=UPI00094F81E2|nr:LLM class oxidoreductase [Labilibacter marinus]